MRINRASDDAAGLSISADLNASSRVYTQAVRNLNDGVSILNVAETAMESMQSILIRQRELATQAANGVYSTAQRRGLNAEAARLTEEYNRIADSASFNGRRLFSAADSTVNLQAGFGSLIVDGAADALRNVGSGVYTQADFGNQNALRLTNADLNGDGKSDLITASGGGVGAALYVSNGDGTFKAGQNITLGISCRSVEIADLDRDGDLDVVGGSYTAGGGVRVGLNNGTGSVTLLTTINTGSNNYDITVADFNEDGVSDIASVDTSANTMSLFFGNGDGYFRAGGTVSVGLFPSSIESGDINGDGHVDLLTGDVNSNQISRFLGDGKGGFTRISSIANVGAQDLALEDLDHDGALDLVASAVGYRVLKGNGDGSFGPSVSYTGGSIYGFTTADLNGDGFIDLAGADSSGAVGVFFNSGDGSFSSVAQYNVGVSRYGTAAFDANGDGAVDIFTAQSGAMNAFWGDPMQTAHIERLNLCSGAGALHALNVLDGHMERLRKARGSLGSDQSRLSTALSNLTQTRNGWEEANCRITDADIAEESATLTAANIRTNIAAAILSQQNQQFGISLDLIRSAAGR